MSDSVNSGSPSSETKTYSVREDFQRLPLRRAAALGEADLVKAFLEKDADPFVVDEEGRTLLHHACKDEEKAVATAFLEAYIRPTKQDQDRRTAFHLAT